MSQLRPSMPHRSRVLSPPVQAYRRRRHEAPAAASILGATRSLPALRWSGESASALGRVEVIS